VDDGVLGGARKRKEARERERGQGQAVEGRNV
jgi:hypothetical protein